MTTSSNVENCGLLSGVVTSLSCNRILGLLRQTLLTSLLVGLIWLPGLPFSSAFAMPGEISGGLFRGIPGETAQQIADTASIENARMDALIACLPKELSQPNLKRALSEMGNDQIERAFNLNAHPKLSSAEIELASCMSRQGFTS